jgi:putative nucleotidyltransferase with HDIG domain
MQTAVQVPSKDSLVQRAGDLKVLPSVAKKVMETVEKENTSAVDLSRVIENDEAITSRVLKIANSAFYGLRSQVKDLRHAVALLGFSNIKNLVITASTRGLHKSFGITEQLMWDHSVGSAVGARLLARGDRQLQDLAFLSGLLHDVGQVVLNNETPQIYADVTARVYNEGVAAIDVEREIYGYDHTDVGAGVLTKWGFPEELVEVVDNHHMTKVSIDKMSSALVSRAVACVQLADSICRYYGIGSRAPDETIVLHDLPAAVYLSLGEKELTVRIGEIKGTYDMEKASFE